MWLLSSSLIFSLDFGCASLQNCGKSPSVSSHLVYGNFLEKPELRPSPGCVPSYFSHVQARTLEWVTMPSSKGPSQPRDRTCISCLGRQILYRWATREPPINEQETAKKKKREKGGIRIRNVRTSVVVHWLGVCAPNTGGLCSISGQGAGSCMLQPGVPCHSWRSYLPKLKLSHATWRSKILRVTSETEHSQIKKFVFIFF